MSDEIGVYAEPSKRAIAASEAKARQIHETAITCAKCGGPLMRWGGGRIRHHSCEEGSMAGQVCTCPPECSDVRWGDGPRDCDPGCVPCRNMRGQPLRKRGRS